MGGRKGSVIRAICARKITAGFYGAIFWHRSRLKCTVQRGGLLLHYHSDNDGDATTTGREGRCVCVRVGGRGFCSMIYETAVRPSFVISRRPIHPSLLPLLSP